MASVIKNLVSTKYLETTQTAQYAPDGFRAVLDKCIITNVSTVNVKLNVNIVADGFSASASNKVISNRLLLPNESYECPEVVGIVLESRSFISTLSDTASALTFNLSGREIT